MVDCCVVAIKLLIVASDLLPVSRCGRSVDCCRVEVLQSDRLLLLICCCFDTAGGRLIFQLALFHTQLKNMREGA